METTFTRSRIMSMMDKELVNLAKDDLEIPFAGMIGTTELRKLVLGRLEEAGRVVAEETPKPPALSAEDLRVKQVLDWLPRGIAFAKSKSWSTFGVMKVEDECIPTNTPNRWPDVNEINLKGVTKRIFDHCVQQGLKPEIKRKWNGCGYDYRIVAQTPS